MAQDRKDKTTGRLRWASQRHPKGRQRKSTALSVFRRLSRADLRPPSATDGPGDLEQAAGQTQNSLSPQSPTTDLPSAPKPEQPNGMGVFTGSGSVSSAPIEVESTKKKRTIYFNMRLPPEETHDDGTPIAHYARNKIRTAKYTPLTFIPKNLFLQFHNVANIYFTFIVILQVSNRLLPCNPPFPRQSFIFMFSFESGTS